MLSVLDVSKYILGIVCEDEGDLISNLKLQKLLYYAQGFYLAMYDKPLFEEEIEAWTHGPVVPVAYHAYKDNGSGHIPIPEELDNELFSESAETVLNEVYEVYGQYEASVLRNFTHNEPPWQRTAPGAIISTDLMRNYFKTQLVVNA